MRHGNSIRSAGQLLSLGALFGLLSACATSGVIQGRLDGQSVQLHYHHSFWQQNGTVTTSLPSGEHFSGKFVIGTTTTTGVGVGAGTGDVGVFTGSGNTSNAAAVLMGDKGNSMHCGFTLAKPDAGLEGGGVARCKVSTGQVVDATF